MSSRGDHRGGRGGGSGNRSGSRSTPRDKTSKASQGENKRVTEILERVQALSIREMPELMRGLEGLNLLGSSRVPAFSRDPNANAPPSGSDWASQVESEMEEGGAPLKTASYEVGLKSATPLPSQNQSETTAGSTRRTMFRKARKALKDSSGNPEASESALTRLRYLADRFGVSLEEALPPGFESLLEKNPKSTESTPKGKSRDGPAEGAGGTSRGSGGGNAPPGTS